MRGRKVAGTLVGLSFLLTSVAHAAPALRVEPSSLPGAMPAADRERLEASLRTGLDRVEIETTRDAEAPALRMSIAADEADYVVTLEVQDASGVAMAEAEVECELCGVAELNESIAAAASRLRQRLDLSAEAVSLTVRTQPGAADVYVDGEATGKTPVGTSVPAGSHELRIERRGYRPISTRFEATGGSDSTFDYALRPRVYRVAVPWTLIGVGAAMVGGGAALVAIDGDPILNDCNADVMGRCEFIRKTQPGGIAMISAGAAALVSGVVLAVLWRRSKVPDAAASLRRWRWAL